MTIRRAAPLLLLTCTLAACAATRPAVLLSRPSPGLPPAEVPTASDEQAARLAAEQAAAREGAGDAAAAEALRQQLLQRYPATDAAARIYLAQAVRQEAEGKLAAALQAYEHLLFYRPQVEHGAAIREAYAGLLARAGRHEDARLLLESLAHAARATADRRRLGEAWASAAVAAGHPEAALAALVELMQLPDVAGPQRLALQARAEGLLPALGPEQVKAACERAAASPGWAPLAAALGLRRADVLLGDHAYAEAEALLTEMQRRFATDPHRGAIDNALALLRARAEVDRTAVGVLLPLSGRYKQYGERSLRAIELQFPPGGRFKLVVRDTEGDATVAAAALEGLVLGAHVAAVIGPMFSAEAMAAAERAQALGVPLLALSHRDGLPELGPYIFRTALTVAEQARSLAEVAFETLQFRRFAILYPRSRYGVDFMQAFWDEIDRRHGEMRGAEAYDPDQTTFREPVRRLVGRWFVNARPDYRAATEALKEQKLSPLRMRTEMERLDKGLPPVVDFDALVIPDSGRQIGLIAPALAFEDVVLTHDPKLLERVKKARNLEALQPLTLMGASTWNSAQTLESCGDDCSDAVFVDAYFPNSTEPAVRDFIAGFRAAAGGAEPYLSEAQAYDTAGWLRQALAAAPPPADREALRAALAHGRPYRGVTGTMRFDAQGSMHKDLFVLTIRERTIRLWEPPAGPTRG